LVNKVQHILRSLLDVMYPSSAFVVSKISQSSRENSGRSKLEPNSSVWILTTKGVKSGLTFG
jgi:hypothetical protein